MVCITSNIHGRIDCLKKLLNDGHFCDYIDTGFIDVIDCNNKSGVAILKWLLFLPNT